MLIDCVYRQGDMCRAVNENINIVSETRGWGCACDIQCGWIMPGATGKDSDFCRAFENARRLGFKLPTNSNKAYRKRKKRDKCGKYRRVRNFYFKKKR